MIIGNQEYEILPVYKAGPLFTQNIRNMNAMYRISREQQVANVIAKCIDKLLDEHNNSGKCEPAELQTLFDHAIINCYTLWKQPNDKHYCDRVRLEYPAPLLERFIPNSKGVLDYATISLGSNIGFSMRECEPKHLQSKITRENLLAMGYNRRRTATASIDSSCPVIPHEEPWVKEPGTSPRISGAHLVTGIVHYRNYKEAVTMSTRVHRAITVLYRKHHIVEVSPTILQKINNGEGWLGKPGESSDRQLCLVQCDDFNKYITVREKTVIEKVSIHVVEKAEGIVIRLKFDVATHHQPQHGDKVCNRHGFKGTIEMVPEEHMPVVKLPDGKLHPVDVLISPLAVLHRRQMGHFVEMAANLQYMAEGKTEVGHFEQGLIDYYASETPYYEYDNVKINGQEVSLYAAPIYWMFLDKLAVENYNPVYEHKFKSQNGNWINSGAISGVKLSTPELMLLQEKGMHQFANQLITINQPESAVEHVNTVLECYERCFET